MTHKLSPDAQRCLDALRSLQYGGSVDAVAHVTGIHPAHAKKACAELERAGLVKSRQARVGGATIYEVANGK